MAPVDVAGEAAKAAPGIIGAFVALRWMPGTPFQRVAAFVGGSAASYYGAEHMVRIFGLTPGMLGFLSLMIGLFGMAIASKVFEGIDSLRIGRRIEKLLDRWGL